MNAGPDLIAMGIFLRTMFVWWGVSYWARSRYRRDLMPGVADPTSSVSRVSGNAGRRRAPFYFAGRWLVGFVLIALSAATALLYAPTGLETESTFGLNLCAIAFQAVFLHFAEVFAQGNVRRILVRAGWLLVTATTLLFSIAMVQHTSVESIAQSILEFLGHPVPWTIGLGVFLAVFPLGEWIGSFLNRWSDHVPDEEGLPGGGKWIGRLERLLIVSCLIAGQPAGIAILVTAKGAFRFGEIRSGTDQDEQRRLVEYILIGSMLSYASALAVGWTVSAVLQVMPPLLG